MSGSRIERFNDADIEGLYEYCEQHGLEITGIATDASEDSPEPRLRLVLRKVSAQEEKT